MGNKNYNWDHLVYMRLFEGCNLYCEHCFIPSNPKKISLEFYKNKNVTETLLKNSDIQIGDTILFQWHGGEPTLLGPQYLSTAIRHVEEDDRFIYQHGIQTNLVNFHEHTAQWVDLYKKHFNSHIGVSWDYKIRHLNRKAIGLETNTEYENIFWNNIELAKQNGLELYFVITATKLFFERYKNPFEFYDFIVSSGISYLNFERITKNGIARLNWDKLGLTNLEYSNYMVRFYKYYKLYKKNNPNCKLHISPFDGLEESVKLNTIMEDKRNLALNYKNQGYGCWSGKCDTKFHTIDANGYKHGCTAINSESDNLNKKFIAYMGKNTVMLKTEQLIKNERQIRSDTCKSCEFKPICSTGCLSIDKTDESKECSGSSILFKYIKSAI